MVSVQGPLLIGSVSAESHARTSSGSSTLTTYNAAMCYSKIFVLWIGVNTDTSLTTAGRCIIAVCITIRVSLCNTHLYTVTVRTLCIQLSLVTQNDLRSIYSLHINNVTSVIIWSLW